jgi:hypothetical protein
MPRHVPETLDIYVIYSARQTLPMRVRKLVEFLRDWTRTPPAWAAPAAPSTPTRRGGRRADR